ncbi:MAG TPA: tetratricopeptide repeat protein, partial [Herpetosiphonaceae bacterium]
SQRIGDKQEEAVISFNLGHAYLEIPSIRDLTQADYWYKHCLELRDESDYLGRGKCQNQLGAISYQRFVEARVANHPVDQLLNHLNTAIQFCFKALELLPSDAIDDLAVSHNTLGAIYAEVRDLDRGLPHWREAIRYHEAGNNFYNAGITRFNIALALYNAGRLEDALLYAQAALRNFERYSQGAAEMVQETQRLILRIKDAIQRKT